MTHNNDHDPRSPVTEDHFDPLGPRDFGEEGMRLIDDALTDRDPAERVQRDGEPGPRHDIDPRTEGSIERDLRNAVKVTDVEDDIADLGLDINEAEVDRDLFDGL